MPFDGLFRDPHLARNISHRHALKLLQLKSPPALRRKFSDNLSNAIQILPCASAFLWPGIRANTGVRLPDGLHRRYSGSTRDLDNQITYDGKEVASAVFYPVEVC